MSTAAPHPPRVSVGGKGAFVLVASQFNATFVDRLVKHVTDELRALAPESAVAVHRVPGAFEIPVVVRELALQQNADAIIALGVIIKGQTSHADHLSHSVTNALQQIAIAHGVPVINAVLSVENEQQARERCLEQRINRGIEAARAAVQIANVMSELRAS